MPKISQLTSKAAGQLTGTENVPLQIGTGNGKTTLTDMKGWLETVLQTGSNVTVSDNAPTDSSEGDLWYDSTAGGLYVWVSGSTNAWIQTNGGGQGGGGGASVTVSSTAPADPVEGDLWYDDTNAILYVYVAGTTNAWVQAGGGGGGGGGGGDTKINSIVVSGRNASFTIPDWDPSWRVCVTGLADPGSDLWAGGAELFFTETGWSYTGSPAPWSIRLVAGSSTELILIFDPATGQITQAIGNGPTHDPTIVYGVYSTGSSDGVTSGGGPRAYVVFNGAAGSPTSITDSITDSLNVDSITTSGTGEYHVNLSTPITNPKLVVSPIMQYSSGSGDYQHDTDVAAMALPHDSNGLGATTTSQIRVETYYNATLGADVGAPVHLLVF